MVKRITMSNLSRAAADSEDEEDDSAAATAADQAAGPAARQQPRRPHRAQSPPKQLAAPRNSGGRLYDEGQGIYMNWNFSQHLRRKNQK